jgi:hypothetical protein
MDARPHTRRVDRQRKPAPPQPPRGAKQIVIPMTRQQYDEIWHDAARTRVVVAEWVQSAPELFPPGFDRGRWRVASSPAPGTRRQTRERPRTAASGASASGWVHRRNWRATPESAVSQFRAWS